MSLVEVNDSSGRWYSVRDGSNWLLAFRTEEEGFRGLRVARQHSRYCFIDRNAGTLTQYWR